MTDHTRRRFWLKIAAGLLLAPLIYGGAYFAVLRHAEFDVPLPDGTTKRLGYLPAYRVPGGVISEKTLAPLFWPALSLDYAIRPRHWVSWTRPYGVGRVGEGFRFQ